MIKTLFVTGLFMAVLMPIGHWGDQSEQKLIAANNGSPVIITTNDCVNEKVKAFINPETLPQFHAGTVFFQGEIFNLCYIITTLSDGQDYVLVVDEVGDSGAIPYLLFKEMISI